MLSSEEAQEASVWNKLNSKKNIIPHRLGSRGYAKKVPKWDRQEEEMVERGVTHATADWEPDPKRFILERGVSYSEDRSLALGCSQSVYRSASTRLSLCMRRLPKGGSNLTGRGMC